MAIPSDAKGSTKVPCPDGKKDCIDAQIQKIGGGGSLNNEFQVISISSETIFREGAQPLASLRIVLKANHALEGSEIAVSLASVLMNDKLNGGATGTPIVVVTLPKLEAGEITLVYFNDLVLTVEGRTFWCLSK